MEFTSLKIKNFLSFGPSGISLEKLGKINTIVGINNSGKTNLFRVLDYVRDEMRGWSRSSINIGDHLFFVNDKSENNQFTIELGIKFSGAEQNALLDFLVISTAIDITSMSPPLLPTIKESKDLVRTVIRNIFSTILNNENIKITIEGKEARYSEHSTIKVTSGTNELFISDRGLSSKYIEPNDMTNTVVVGGLLTDEIKAKGLEFVRNVDSSWLFQKLQDIENRPTVIRLAGVGIVNGIIEEMEEVWRIRDLRPGLEETNLVRFVGVLLDNSMVGISDLRSAPRGFLDPDFQSIPSHISKMDGSELGLVLFKLKNSKDKKDRDRYSLIQKTFQEITIDSKFDVALNTFFYHKISLETTRVPVDYVEPSGNLYLKSYNQLDNLNFVASGEDKKQYTGEMPIIYVETRNHSVPLPFAFAGSFEILLLLTVFVGMKDKIILLDEPALNLHPIKQMKFYQKFKDIIYKEKTNNQYFIISHSPYFISTDADRLKTTWKFKIESGETTIFDVADILKGLPEDKINRILGETDIRSLLFSKGVVLVEGISDKIVIELIDEYLVINKNEISIFESEWSIADIGGKSNVGSYIKLANAFAIPYAAIVDRDALMFIDSKVLINGKEVKTSCLIKSLYEMNLLKEEEINKIKEYEASIESVIDGTKTRYFYKDDKFDELFNVVKRNNILVLKNDLENAIRNNRTSDRNKPLKDVETIKKKINDGTISQLTEALDLVRFVKDTIKRNTT